MADYLFDTDVLVDVLRGHAPTVERLAGLPSSAGKRYSIVTEAELWTGVPDGNAAAARALERLLSAMDVVYLDRAAAREAGTYRQRYGARIGTSLPDALIAASAKRADCILVTRNKRHFPMEDVNVLTPEELDIC